jgi:paraquat-inducible protein B
MNDEARRALNRTEATVRRTAWPGWIWAIPLAVLLLVGWWALRALLPGGADIAISFADAHGLKAGDTSIVYRGMKVGRITGLALVKDGSAVEARAHIEESAKDLLRSETVFWLRGASPSLSDPASLAAIVSGPTVVMEPGPGDEATRFNGLLHRPVLSGGKSEGRTYEVLFDAGSIGKLRTGDPVTLRGFAVGEVKDVEFRLDPRSGEVATPVLLTLYPSLFHLDDKAGAEGKATLAAATDRLIRGGLHARLERNPPLIGDPQVTLDLVPDQPAATVSTAADGTPLIPAASGDGLSSVIDRVNRLPIDQIGQNVLDATHHVDEIASSPKLADAVAELDSTLKQIHETASKAGPKITELADSLRKTAAKIDSAAAKIGTAAGGADKLLGGTPAQNNAQQALAQIADAARSVRELADYLDRHPEALVKGRSAQ